MRVWHSLGLASAAAAAVLESLAAVPEGWERVKDADRAQHMKLKIALQQPNTDLFEKTLYDVSTPQHAMYGKHMKRHEVADMLKPRPESIKVVLDWLKTAGITQVQNDGDWINFRANVDQINHMLKTSLSVYRNGRTEKIRTLSYSVPDHIIPHVTMITPLIRFGDMHKMRSTIFNITHKQDVPDFGLVQAAAVPKPVLARSCNSQITPECLRALYKIDDYQAPATNKSLFGVAGYLEVSPGRSIPSKHNDICLVLTRGWQEYAQWAALAAFNRRYAPYATDANFSVISVNGGKNIQSTRQSAGEANLDVQYAVSLAYKTPIVYYSTGGRGPLVPDLDQPDPNEISNEPYLEFLQYMTKLSDSELPQTLTTSYGENEQSVPVEYNKKVCQMFGQLGARGVSVLFASGDEGPGSACQTNDGKNTTRFMATFPGACPYITSVGATHGIEPERAVSYSSGGFSELYPRPAYQNSSVEAFLKINGEKWKQYFNASGRGFPDVAAQGSLFHIVDASYDTTVSGTSASAPVFAAIVSLLNSARLAAGKPPLGFLNPWLYSDAASALTE